MGECGRERECMLCARGARQEPLGSGRATIAHANVAHVSTSRPAFVRPTPDTYYVVLSAVCRCPEVATRTAMHGGHDTRMAYAWHAHGCDMSGFGRPPLVHSVS